MRPNIVHTRVSTSPAAKAGWSPYAEPSLINNRQATGLIKQLDRKHHRIKLGNGRWYVAPPAMDIKALRIGDSVEVFYDINHHHYYACSIMPV